MNILTDEEMKQIHADTFGKGVQSFARAIEAAIMAKLEEQAGEPVLWMDEYGVIWPRGIDGSTLKYKPLYTESQLIAAHQRTAEACAKAVSAEYLTDPHDATDGAYNLALDHAIGGMKRWREYLWGFADSGAGSLSGTAGTNKLASNDEPRNESVRNMWQL